MYTPEQLHSDVIASELEPEELVKLIKELTDDEAWVVVSTLNSEVLTLEQLEGFWRFGLQFRNDIDTDNEDATYREVKVFKRQFFGLELRMKKTPQELIDAAISREEVRRRMANRNEAERMAEEAADRNL